MFTFAKSVKGNLPGSKPRSKIVTCFSCYVSYKWGLMETYVFYCLINFFTKLLIGLLLSNCENNIKLTRNNGHNVLCTYSGWIHPGIYFLNTKKNNYLISCCICCVCSFFFLIEIVLSLDHKLTGYFTAIYPNAWCFILSWYFKAKFITFTNMIITLYFFIIRKKVDKSCKL